MMRWLVGLMGALCLVETAHGDDVVRRAVVVGANDGGSYLQPLLYAEQDAQRISEVLIDLAAFAPYDVDYLATPTLDELDDAFAAAAAASYTGSETLFVFYYSGHADEQGLHIAGQLYPWQRLKQAVRDIPAEVRLGILDACRSGAVTRIKGALVSEPFLPTRLDAVGEAWISSAAADEDAQESDLLRGSFFTYHLVSGLRGAADDGADGWVSLNEAYSFAYRRTVAQTSGTGASTQHPRYAFDIRGNGDLRLTSLISATSSLVFPAGLYGEVVVVSEPEQLPVGELTLSGEREVVLAVRPGDYTLRRRDTLGLSQATVTVASERRVLIDTWSDGLADTTLSKGPGASLMALPTPPRTRGFTWSWFAHNKGIAASLSTLLPGMGQIYDGRWASGSAFFASTVIGNGVGWGAVALHPESLMRGIWSGPNAGTLAGLMLYTFNIADAVYRTGDSKPFGPRSGVAIAVGSAWTPSTTNPIATGLSLDIHPTPEVSIGLERTGFWFGDDQVIGRASVRLSTGPAFNHWHPAAFFAVGARYGLDIDGVEPVEGSALLGVGGLVRWYATPTYFLSVDVRAEWSSNPGDLSLILGAELGLHIGRRQRRGIVDPLPTPSQESG